MELFHDVKIDWLGKKWYFLGFSLIFSVAGVLSMLFWHHIPLDVDFRGGTVVRVKFDQTPDLDRIRSASDSAGIKDVRIQRYGRPADNEVIISLALSHTSENALDQGRAAILQALENHYLRNNQANAGKLDLDNAGQGTLANWLAQKDPEHLGQNDAAQQHYSQQAAAVLSYRDEHSGLIGSVDELSGKISPAVLGALKQDAYLSGFAIRNVEIVGPQVGAQLRNQAMWAIL